jgi:hypothetical protein
MRHHVAFALAILSSACSAPAKPLPAPAPATVAVAAAEFSDSAFVDLGVEGDEVLASIVSQGSADGLSIESSDTAAQSVVFAAKTWPGTDYVVRYRARAKRLNTGGTRVWYYAVAPSAIRRDLLAGSLSRMARGTLQWASVRSTASPSTSGSSGGSVQVRGYCRRDGVCVRPHTRRRPRS